MKDNPQDPQKTKKPKNERAEAIAFCRQFYKIVMEKKLYLRNDLTRVEYARMMHTNHVYFCRKLKLGTGLNLNLFIKGIRMTIAYKLLKSTNYDMATIMDQCGYCDKSSFYRAFHERFHCAPSTLRNRFFANA